MNPSSIKTIHAKLRVLYGPIRPSDYLGNPLDELIWIVLSQSTTTVNTERAYAALRKGGKAIVVGVAKPKDMTTIRTASLTFEEKTITGSYFGSARPREDAPRILGLYKSGKVKLDELITRTYSIDEAPQAFADLEAGRNARGVIVF